MGEWQLSHKDYYYFIRSLCNYCTCVPVCVCVYLLLAVSLSLFIPPELVWTTIVILIRKPTKNRPFYLRRFSTKNEEKISSAPSPSNACNLYSDWKSGTPNQIWLQFDRNWCQREDKITFIQSNDQIIFVSSLPSSSDIFSSSYSCCSPTAPTLRWWAQKYAVPINRRSNYYFQSHILQPAERLASRDNRCYQSKHCATVDVVAVVGIAIAGVNKTEMMESIFSVF